MAAQLLTCRNLGRQGRLGNQLFQFASSYGIAMRNGDDLLLPADWIYRPYFSVPDEFFTDKIPDHALETCTFADNLGPREKPYLQDVSLFWPYMDEIRHYLRPSDLAAKIMKTPVYLHHDLCVHVRRGDNVADEGVPNKYDYYICPDADYYRRGIEAFPEMPLSIFSDDIPWCKENLPEARFYGNGIGHPKEHLSEYWTTEPIDWMDLFMMGLSDHFVITGSTFAIWGAILAYANAENVVRPDRVYGPLLDYINISLLFPPDWRTISAT